MLNPYPLQENDEYSYEFVTDQHIRYAIYFLDYSVMFAQYPGQVYMFNIDVITGNPDESVMDERIGITVLHIFNDFFQKLQNIAVYVCDNMDDRHLARKRKFDRWFWKYNDGTLIKEDDLALIDGAEIYTSMIVHKQNQYLKEIILAYKTLTEKVSEK